MWLMEQTDVIYDSDLFMILYYPILGGYTIEDKISDTQMYLTIKNIDNMIEALETISKHRGEMND